MNRARVLGRARAALSALVLAAALAGCGPQARDRWLRILFDDPPAPPIPSPAETVPGPAASAPAAAAVDSGGAPASPSLIPSAAVTVHAPVAGNACGQCHDLSGSLSYRGALEADAPPEAAPATPAQAAAPAARLVAPAPDLCLRCHGEFALQALAARGAVVHGPVAAGECLFCHDPHRSAAPALLRWPTAAQACAHCHEAAADAPDGPHAGAEAAACLRCHDPHAGAAGLLRQVRP